MSQVVVCQFTKLQRVLSNTNLSEEWQLSLICSQVPGQVLHEVWYVLSSELHFGLHHLHGEIFGSWTAKFSTTVSSYP